MAEYNIDRSWLSYSESFERLTVKFKHNFTPDSASAVLKALVGTRAYRLT